MEHTTRVSTLDQKRDAQLDALTQAGCAKIFSDRVSGATADRPGWEQLMAYMDQRGHLNRNLRF
jgi:DNA invertase Pin-like site-specific DNA recombinase